MSSGRWRPTVAILGACLLATSGAVVLTASPAQAAVLTQHVNPFIGTDDSNSPNPVPRRRRRQHRPGPGRCRSAWCSSARTRRPRSPSGYRFSDNQIQEFSLTHFNGAGCPNNEDIGILPITGNLGTSPGTGWTSYAGDPGQGQRDRPGRLLQGRAQQRTATRRRADGDQAHRRSCG